MLAVARSCCTAITGRNAHKIQFKNIQESPSGAGFLPSCYVYTCYTADVTGGSMSFAAFDPISSTTDQFSAKPDRWQYLLADRRRA
jgi:hypothetical protein